jgi:hypothetical protein
VKSGGVFPLKGKTLNVKDISQASSTRPRNPLQSRSPRPGARQKAGGDQGFSLWSCNGDGRTKTMTVLTSRDF